MGSLVGYIGKRWWWGPVGTWFWLDYVIMSCLLLLSFLRKKKVFILIYFEVFNFNRCFGFLEGTARDFNFCLLRGKIASFIPRK
jgi:hypothetical protein